MAMGSVTTGIMPRVVDSGMKNYSYDVTENASDGRVAIPAQPGESPTINGVNAAWTEATAQTGQTSATVTDKDGNVYQFYNWYDPDAQNSQSPTGYGAYKLAVSKNGVEVTAQLMGVGNSPIYFGFWVQDNKYLDDVNRCTMNVHIRYYFQNTSGSTSQGTVRTMYYDILLDEVYMSAENTTYTVDETVT